MPRPQRVMLPGCVSCSISSPPGRGNCGVQSHLGAFTGAGLSTYRDPLTFHEFQTLFYITSLGRAVPVPFCCHDKHHGQSNLEEKGVISVYRLQSNTDRSQDRNSKQKPWGNAAGLPFGLPQTHAWLASYVAQEHLHTDRCHPQ